MVIKLGVGFEVEYLLKSGTKAIMPHEKLETDGFPLLGEIRGEHGNTPSTASGNFHIAMNSTQEMIWALYKPDRKVKMAFTKYETVPYDLYRTALSYSTTAKGADVSAIRNIYGTDIAKETDLITEDGKILAAGVSCGLHVHFSAIHKIAPIGQYTEYIPLPFENGKYIPSNRKIEVPPVEVSIMTRPVAEYIVRKMDERWFGEFMKDGDGRTKYRKPGYWEPKMHGFEYRSLPACPASVSRLLEIAMFAFDTLREATMVLVV